MSKELADKLGYDLEELYFEKYNRALIHNLRRELDQVRAQAEDLHRDKPYWMRCPKCGSKLREVEVQALKIDRCDRCQGAFLDRGELGILLQATARDLPIPRVEDRAG